jgi:hypothetical protein
VRLCKECKSTIFDRRDFEADVSKKPPEVRAYGNLVQFERGIRLHLPRFQKLLAALQYVYISLVTRFMYLTDTEAEIQGDHHLRHRLPMLRKSASDSLIHLQSTMLRLDGSVTYQRTLPLSNDYRKLYINKPAISCIFICYP